MIALNEGGQGVIAGHRLYVDIIRNLDPSPEVIVGSRTVFRLGLVAINGVQVPVTEGTPEGVKGERSLLERDRVSTTWRMFIKHDSF